jgi:hypothetical protein
MAAKRRFTIYDAMEDRGIFNDNPANPSSVDSAGLPMYKGPVPYPKMLYHPTGETRITVPGEIIVTPIGPKEVGVQREIIWELVDGPEREQELLADGWHSHPAEAIAASGAIAPSMGASGVVKEKDKKIAELEAKLKMFESLEARLAALEGAPPPTPTTFGMSGLKPPKAN